MQKKQLTRVRNCNFKTVWRGVRYEIDYAYIFGCGLHADSLGHDRERSWISHLEVHAYVASRTACEQLPHDHKAVG
jgi:hypothetical protein